MQIARILSVTLLAVSMSGLAAAQSGGTVPSSEVHRQPTGLRHAGIYHYGTGLWTRTGGQTASFGPDVVYCNNANSGYFTSAGGVGGFEPLAENVDEGGLPGTSNPGPFAGVVNRDTYSVNCVQIAYCDLGTAGTSGWTLRFYDSYEPCIVPTVAPAGEIVLSGFPASGACWLVDIDLSAAPICMQADGGFANPGFDNDPDRDSFGWSYQYSGIGTGPAGFVLAGSPAATDASWTPGTLPRDGSGTYYGSSQCGTVGTGYLTRDDRLTITSTGASCSGFSGYVPSTSCTMGFSPYSSFWMVMSADSAPCTLPTCGTNYCMANPNSTGQTGTMVGFGSCVVIEDGLRLQAENLPPQAFGFFLTSQSSGFTPNAGGSQGNLCLSQSIGRFVGQGQTKQADSLGRATLDTRLGEWSVDAIPAPLGPYSAMQGGTTFFQFWHRDSVAGVATSNFTDGLQVDWL